MPPIPWLPMPSSRTSRMTSNEYGRRVGAGLLRQADAVGPVPANPWYLVAIVMAVGSSFAAMNTMYAAVARRSREIGTLRVLGFSRASILLSFFSESLLLAILGGLIGCLLVLPLNGVTTGVGNFQTFAETDFNLTVTPAIMLTGILFAVLMGAVGGL